AHGAAGKVLPVLHDHQISMQKLTAPVELELEVYYATSITADQYFQGKYLREVTAEKRTETMTLPAGTLFIPSGQARSNEISYLLEPETDDNVITWSYLDDFLQGRPAAAPAPAGAAAPPARGGRR